ncbi:MAG: glutamyl-tRNA reductase [Deltaproteobacteria bacterium]|nr:glutamyl-tRNA reductase [Deltaproteobacteria bacterium]
MEVGVLGWSYKKTSVELRDKIALSAVEQAELADRLKNSLPIEELTILSTCNRTEFYFSAREIKPISSELLEFLIKRWDLEELKKQAYQIQDVEMARHLFRVASSLDSMVLGEPQILGQLKEAFQRFQNLGWVGGRFNYLFPNAFHTAKRVRTETGISNYAVSISFAAVELAKRIFSDLSQQRVLIIGAGEMAELALQNLKSHGVADVMVTNRTYTNAENLADKFAGTAISFEQLENRLCEADIIISSTGARHFILTQSMVRKCLKKRRARAMFFIDIAVPRDIEPEINDLPGAYCYDIDDLQNVVQKNQEERVRQAEQADKILEDEIARVQDWFLTRSAVPTIRKIRNEFEHISQAELEKTLLRLSHLSDKDIDSVTSLVHRITQKILHNPTMNMKALSKEEDRSLQLQVLLDVFSEKEANKKLLDEKKPNLKLVRGSKSL